MANNNPQPKASKMSKATNHKMIRVPSAVADRLQKIADEMLKSYEEGRTDKVEITEQGAKGCWVALHTVMSRCMDEYEDHKNRSRKSSKKAKSPVAAVEASEEVTV